MWGRRLWGELAAAAAVVPRRPDLSCLGADLRLFAFMSPFGFQLLQGPHRFGLNV